MAGLFSLTLVPLTAQASVARVGVTLRPLGPTSVAQGSRFSFRATLRNPDPSQAQVTVTFRLVSVDGGGGAVDAIAWHATVPGQGSTSASFAPVSSQWFADQGTFEVHALINGQDATGPLSFVVTPPTVAIPKFEDVTVQAGLDTTIGQSMCGAWAAGAAWGDVDGDGDLDLYVPRGTDPAQLWINDGAGHFTEEAVARGVDDHGASGLGAVFADYDNDGDQDLYVANDGPNRLYQNDGTGHFSDVAESAGVVSLTDDVSATWGDYDNDGYLDLYVVSNSPCLPPLFYEQDHLFHNEGDGTFTDQTSLLPAASTFGAGFQAAWFDYDGDGDQDLYLANDRWGPSPDANHLWRNDGPGLDGTWRFADVSTDSRTGYFINSMGIAVGDFNRDLNLDFAISNIKGNLLARNEGGGSFTEVASTAGVERPFQRADLHSITWGLAFADLNLDGWEDLLVAAGALTDRQNQPNEVFTAAGDGTFLDLSALSGADDPGSGRGVAIADYDRDGRLDAYVVNRLGSPILYRNATSTSGHWLEVDLTGTNSNRDGCGARLFLTAGGARQLREVFCGSVGLSSGSDTVAPFGLGAAGRVDRLVIEWPSGQRQVLRNLAANRLIAVVEPA
ncbi:MAG: CRTAC1 family protein [Actinobacteria bacterium]|nr:MAG: CRTAC1 family protein [Actinomycetota bacterium]